MMNEQNEFEKLTKLIALKRFEKPPAGYFENFSSRVISRIENENQPGQQSWIIDFIRLLTTRPVYAACAVVVLIGLTLILMRPSSDVQIQLNQGLTQNNPWELVQPSKQEQIAEQTGNYGDLPSAMNQGHSSTNPVMPNNQMPSLFQRIPTLVTPTPASYSSER